MIRSGRMDGAHFRRQCPVGLYVADFACHALALIIEVDGDQHADAIHRHRDARRDNWLAGEGYRVLRFSNGDVVTERDSVRLTIEAAVLGRLPVERYAVVPVGYVTGDDTPTLEAFPTPCSPAASPPPCPPPQGGRVSVGDSEDDLARPVQRMQTFRYPQHEPSPFYPGWCQDELAVVNPSNSPDWAGEGREGVQGQVREGAREGVKQEGKTGDPSEFGR